MRPAPDATRRGEQVVAVLLLLIVLAPIGAADERAAAAIASRSPVDQAIEAHQRGSASALRTLAAQAGPRIWELVERVLLVPDGHATARALARASADPDRSAVLRYVMDRKGKRHAPETLHALEEARSALRAKRYAAAAILLETIHFDPDSVSAVIVLTLRAQVLRHRGRGDESTEGFMEAADAAQRIGWRAHAADLLAAGARQAVKDRDYAVMRRAADRRYNLLRARGDASKAAACLADIATACARQSDFPCARLLYVKAIDALRAVGQNRNAAVTRANLGLLHHKLGELERALTHLESALATLRKRGSDADIAETLSLLGFVRVETGQYTQALAHQKEALALMQAHKLATPELSRSETHTLAVVLGNIAYTYMLMAQYDQAQAHLLKAIDLFEHTLNDPYLVAVAMADLADLSFRRGDLVSATAQIRGAMHYFETQGNAGDIAKRRVLEGRIRLARGETAEAARAFSDARAAGERLRLYAVVVDAMTEHAALCLAQGELEKAGELAFAAVDLLGSSLAHLADGEGAEARRKRLRTYQMPIRVALATGNVEDCAEALDESRAGSFLEAMGGRVALRELTLPPDLLRQLKEAQEEEALVWSEGKRALRRRSPTRRRKASKRIALARKRTEAAHEALQRTARHAADSVYPRADELTAIQASLEPRDALVLYSLLAEESVALVITRERATIRRLPPEALIRKACEAILLGGTPFIDASKAPMLRAAIIEPLKLDPKTRRLLISPEGILTYVPFSLLLPKHAIAYVPSATSYRMLRPARALRGQGVVAFGDPAYGAKARAQDTPLHRGLLSWRPSRLAASGDEARAVGSRGRVFVGAAATEAQVRAAVAPTRRNKRIRALHLAGHGLADAEYPQLSCIALTPSGRDDGYLMGREVMGMQIAADLVVLSACESVRGKVVRGEGLQGLTRAFMFAGAPRVLASLWKVDDVATKAFMVKFYELWNGKDADLGAAEALRLTQEYMRTETPWKAPKHWAAWVLWGLPD